MPSIAEHPDIIRGRAAAQAVKAAGGTAMEQALKFIEVAFDAAAKARADAARAARPSPLLSPDDGAPRTVCIMAGTVYGPNHPTPLRDRIERHEGIYP